jgi:hypothetical protein
MRKSAERLAKFVGLFAGVGGFVLLAGCEDSGRQADKDAQKKVDDADAAKGAADASQATQFDQWTMDPAISPAMKAQLSGRAAQSHLDQGMAAVGDLRALETGIFQKITQIQQLASQLDASQQYIASLQKYDPSAHIAELQAKLTAIQGAAGQDTWTVATPTGDDPTGHMDVPTGAKLSATIDALTAAIAKNQSDAADLTKKRTDDLSQAEALARKAEAETGDQLLADATNASNLRHDAAIADAQMDTLSQEMDKLKLDLANSQAQKTTIDSAIATINAQIQTEQSAWKSVQDQMAAQQAFQKKLINGPWEAPPGGWPTDKARPATITDLANDLTSLIYAANGKRATALAQLALASKMFGQAAAAAQLVRNDIGARIVTITTNQPNDVDLPILQQEMETLHPFNFIFQKASVDQTIASVDGAKVIIDTMLNEMRKGYSVSPADAASAFKEMSVKPGSQISQIKGLDVVLNPQKTGVPFPAAVTSLRTVSDSDMDTARKNVDGEFKDAVDLFDKKYGNDMGANKAARTNTGLYGKSVAERQWADFDNLVGETKEAAIEIKQADEDESNVDPVFRGVVALADTSADAAGTTQPSFGATAGGTGTPAVAPGAAATPGATPTAGTGDTTPAATPGGDAPSPTPNVFGQFFGGGAATPAPGGATPAPGTPAPSGQAPGGATPPAGGTGTALPPTSP